MDIGIIGGADGPTSIFISSNINWYAVASLAIVGIVVIVMVSLAIRKRNS